MFIIKDKLNRKEDRNSGNKGQKAIRHIEKNNTMTELSPSLSVITVNINGLKKWKDRDWQDR